MVNDKQYNMTYNVAILDLNLCSLCTWTAKLSLLRVGIMPSIINALGQTKQCDIWPETVRCGGQQNLYGK